MDIKTLSQTIGIDEVTDVVVTEIELSVDGYVREIRVIGPSPEGSEGPGPVIFVLRLTGASREAIEVSAPASQF